MQCTHLDVLREMSRHHPGVRLVDRVFQLAKSSARVELVEVAAAVEFEVQRVTVEPSPCVRDPCRVERWLRDLKGDVM